MTTQEHDVKDQSLAAVMNMAFANQALSQGNLLRYGNSLKNQRHQAPLEIDRLTDQQQADLTSLEKGA
jgi:S-adenosylhomocysteine hydrolase